MGGIEFYSKICTPYGRSRFPVIILTAMSELSGFFRDVLVDAFISKPIDASQLLAKVEALLAGEEDPLLFLVDDDCPEVEEMRYVLAEERFSVWKVKNIEQLMADIKERKPDFVLAEFNSIRKMKSNWIKELHAMPGCGDVPVLIYSRDAAETNGNMATNAGARCFISKHNDFSQLMMNLRGIRRENYKNEDLNLS
jgi:response regulator RpfG family c-di-GMP phosphodiesterase